MTMPMHPIPLETLTRWWTAELSADEVALADDVLAVAVLRPTANAAGFAADMILADAVSAFAAVVMALVPVVALQSAIAPGGTMTIIEGDHGSAYVRPDSSDARTAIRCLIELQRAAGGNALIGRELYPLMTGAALRDVRVSPRMVYVDASRPEIVEGFTRRTFTAMVEM